MIVFLGAMRDEISGLRRKMGLTRVPADPACHLYKGEYRANEILLAQTGMGRQRAETATKLVLERYSVSMLVSIGVGGALAVHLKVGDIIACSELHCATGPAQGTAGLEFFGSDEDLLGLATLALEDSGLRFFTGRGVTAQQPISSPTTKRELGAAFEADIVDMESYWIARIASEKRIPFVAVRSISDTVDDALPPFDDMLTEDGKLQWAKAISHFARHPRHLATALSLSQNVRAASKRLTAFADCLVAKL